MNKYRVIFGIIGIIVFLFVIIVLFALKANNRLNNSIKIETRTRAVIIALKDNISLVKDAETGQRGYVITQDTNYLEPYNAALPKIKTNVVLLHELTSDNPIEQKNLDSLEKFISQKISELGKVISLEKQGNEEAAKTLVKTNIGESLMDKIHNLNHSMQHEEEKLLLNRIEEEDRSLSDATTTFITEVIISSLVVIFLVLLIMRELNRRIESEKKISEYNTALERKNKEIEQFAYIASHDLREPLRTITSFIGLIEKKLNVNPNKEISEYMDFVRDGATRMTKLISDLLEYSRIGRDFVIKPIDCNVLLGEILADMKASIQESGAKIQADKLPVVNCFGLRYVFQNLLSNAIKYRKNDPPPDIYVTVQATNKEFIFGVKDNGIGIDKKYYDKIFLIFQRLHSRAEYPGTGIGLPHCKKIIEIQGGRIWLESEPGIGSSFYFTIPKAPLPERQF